MDFVKRIRILLRRRKLELLAREIMEVLLEIYKDEYDKAGFSKDGRIDDVARYVCYLLNKNYKGGYRWELYKRER